MINSVWFVIKCVFLLNTSFTVKIGLCFAQVLGIYKRHFCNKTLFNTVRKYREVRCKVCYISWKGCGGHQSMGSLRSNLNARFRNLNVEHNINICRENMSVRRYKWRKTWRYCRTRSFIVCDLCRKNTSRRMMRWQWERWNTLTQFRHEDQIGRNQLYDKDSDTTTILKLIVIKVDKVKSTWPYPQLPVNKLTNFRAS